MEKLANKNKKSLKSRVGLVVLSAVTVLSLGANAVMLSPNADHVAHAATEYVANNYFRPHYVIADPVASSETIAYPTSQQALSNNVSTIIRKGGNTMVMRDSSHQLYSFYSTLNTSFSGVFVVKNGNLVNDKGQVIKLQPVNIDEVKDFAHPGKADAPANTLLLTQSDFNYISQLNGLKVQVNS